MRIRSVTFTAEDARVTFYLPSIHTFISEDSTVLRTASDMPLFACAPCCVVAGREEWRMLFIGHCRAPLLLQRHCRRMILPGVHMARYAVVRYILMAVLLHHHQNKRKSARAHLPFLGVRALSLALACFTSWRIFSQAWHTHTPHGRRAEFLQGMCHTPFL